MKIKDILVMFEALQRNGYIRLYRGLNTEYNPNHNRVNSDSTNDDYTYWTDSYELAKFFSEGKGDIIYVDLPSELQTDGAIDENPNSEFYGDRGLFYLNKKDKTNNGITGDEYLVYMEHDIWDTPDAPKIKVVE